MSNVRPHHATTVINHHRSRPLGSTKSALWVGVMLAAASSIVAKIFLSLADYCFVNASSLWFMGLKFAGCASQAPIVWLYCPGSIFLSFAGSSSYRPPLYQTWVYVVATNVVWYMAISYLASLRRRRRHATTNS